MKQEFVVKAGDGGNGCMAFRREKFVPKRRSLGRRRRPRRRRSSCPPPLATTLWSTSVSTPSTRLERGGHGLGSNCSGYSGEATSPQGSSRHPPLRRRHRRTHPRLRPPQRRPSSSPKADAAVEETSTSPPAPIRPRANTSSDALAKNAPIRLELRLLADAGLVGYPNVGKSTLISRHLRRQSPRSPTMPSLPSSQTSASFR